MTVCFTGHRTIEGVYYNPQNLGKNWLGVWNKTIEIIYKLWQSGHKEFISGGALGFDQLAAQAVLYLKNHNIPIELWMALPFPGFEGKWPAASKTLLTGIVGCADKMFYVNQGTYAAWKMFARNEWMVDNASTVVAMYLPNTKGGTKGCLEYTGKQFKRYITIHPLAHYSAEFVWDAPTKQYKVITEDK